MVRMDYEWDPIKAEANFKKHGVMFADAVTVFSDILALTVEDNSHDEDRFITMGIDALGRVLVVTYTWRAENIRIISARRATTTEREQYGR